MNKLGRKFIVFLAVFLLLGSALSEAAIKGLICYGNDPSQDQFNGEAQKGAVVVKQEYGTELQLTGFVCPAAVPEKSDIPKLEQNWDFVFGIGDNYYNVLAQEAKKHPATKYILLDSYKTTKLNNFKIVEFNNRELGYLAGIVAASASQTGTVGFVGGVKEVPALQEMLLGYTKGAMAVNPQAVVLSQWVGSFNKPKTMTKLAKKLYNKKSDVIFAAAGNSGKGIFEAAREKKKLCIGCDGDVAQTAPQETQEYILASVTKDLGHSVASNIRRIMAGTFSADREKMSFANKGIACIKGPVKDTVWQKPAQAILDFEAQNDLEQEDAFLKESSVKKQ